MAQHKSENGLNFVLKYKNTLFKILSSFDRNDKKNQAIRSKNQTSEKCISDHKSMLFFF